MQKASFAWLFCVLRREEGRAAKIVPAGAPGDKTGHKSGAESVAELWGAKPVENQGIFQKLEINENWGKRYTLFPSLLISG
jgi:hypothetical protein